MLQNLENLLTIPTPLTEVKIKLLDSSVKSVYIKRDELTHPHICGNKWRKLKYNLQAAHLQKCTQLITFGGAFSNHLVAVAAAGAALNIETIGIVRSYVDNQTNPTIDILRSYNMRLYFVKPREYKELMKSGDYTSFFHVESQAFVIPEGGTNDLAIQGVEELVKEILHVKDDFTHILLGIGTGGTLAGISRALKTTEKKIICVSPFKGAIKSLAGFDLLDENDFKNIDIIPCHPPSKFGSANSNLITYIRDFKKNFDIQLDPIYTGKVFMTLEHLLGQGYFSADAQIVVLHTGGIQGIEGFEKMYQCSLS